MLNPRFEALGTSPFVRLRGLLDGIPPGDDPIMMSLGEPQHAPPEMVGRIIFEQKHLFGKYPPQNGTEEFRQAVAGWLNRRFALPDGFIAEDRHLLPLSGTREGLFMAVQVVVPETKGGGTPAVMMPNPFYHAYAGAVAATGADAIFLPVTKELNFLPDLEAISNETWAQTAAFFICSPANPQGSAASCEYYARLVSLARQHDFVVLADECYAEIYDSEPPVSVLEVCAAENNLSNVLSFHSLSKRSNVPGLRSGFVAGNEDLISAFRTVRTFGGAIPPGPTYAASTALFNDDAHVEANRALYREKFDAAEKILSGRFGFYRPDGGFFLWLDVGDGIAATTKLWRQAGIKVLPGAFLGHEDGDGHNPGAPYIRLAVVHDIEVTTRALTKLCDVL